MVVNLECFHHFYQLIVFLLHKDTFVVGLLYSSIFGIIDNYKPAYPWGKFAHHPADYVFKSIF
jgi:hypothetical protein